MRSAREFRRAGPRGPETFGALPLLSICNAEAFMAGIVGDVSRSLFLTAN
jgi:hypothetical protein